MTIQDIKQSYGICGLVCGLCSCRTVCAGCKGKEDSCGIKACCHKKGLDYCFHCDQWPCNRDMHKGIRMRAFNTVAKEEGLDKLAEYLYMNDNRGIVYHRESKLSGDYDKCKNQEEVIDLLKNGRKNPYDVCPTYESRHFILRKVSAGDAADLLECYKNPAASVQANSENCSYGYGSQTLEEMQNAIEQWLEEYCRQNFVRFSIINKEDNRAMGTMEIFDGGRRDHSVLRMDLLSAYESAEPIDELLHMADNFFNDFDCKKIVTKAVPNGVERINALIQNGYIPYPSNEKWEWEHYYIKRRT